MRIEYIQRILVIGFILFFALVVPCHSKMQTVQKGTSTPVQKPVAAEKGPSSTQPSAETAPGVQRRVPAVGATVTSISLKDARGGLTRLRDNKISLEKGHTAVIVVNGKNLHRISAGNISVSGGVKVEKLGRPTASSREVSLKAIETGNCRLELRDSGQTIAAVSITVAAPRKTLATEKLQMKHEAAKTSDASDEGVYIGARVYDGRKVLVETSGRSSDSKGLKVLSKAEESLRSRSNVYEYSVPEDYLASLRTGITLTIWNRSNFELLEVRVHDTLDYLNATNQLQNPPLPDEGQTGVPFESGQYVTVIRRRISGGETIAFTTGRGLDVPENGYVLQVFQESFRLLPPEGN